MISENTAELKREAAMNLYKQGLTVLPCLPNEKQPDRPWKQYQHKRPRASVVRGWWLKKDRDIAVVAGPVSDDAAFFDCDTAEVYEEWREEHRDLADLLPTSRTARGYHVWFRHRTTPGDIFRGRTRIDFGERGQLSVGGIAIVPPSGHPSGFRRSWLIPPDGKLPLVKDLFWAGFIPSGYEPPCSQARQQQRRCARAAIEDVVPDSGFELGPAIEAAIRQHVPTRYGERHARIFDLARSIKAIVPNANDAQLSRILREWYSLSLPRMSTKEFAPSWFDFRAAWGTCRPSGLVLDAVAEGIPPRSREGLWHFCVRLQSHRPSSPFFIDCRSAGKVCCVDSATASRWLKRFCDEGRLVRVSCGDRIRHRAAEYRIVGGQQKAIEGGR